MPEPTPVPAPVVTPTPAPAVVPTPVPPPAPKPLPPVPVVVAPPTPVVPTPTVTEAPPATEPKATEVPPSAEVAETGTLQEEAVPTVLVTEHHDGGSYALDAVLAVLLLTLWRTLTRRIGRHEGEVESLSTNLLKSRLDVEAVTKAVADAGAVLEEVRALREEVTSLKARPAPKPKAPSKKS